MLSKNSEKTIKSDPIPRTPNPTTPKPITAPPEKAISRAFPSECLAASVVLTFAFVATFIPIKPASAEQIAPRINEIETNQLVPSFSPFRANKREVKKTKTAKILYSAFRKAIAPSEIFFAILSIFSEPTSFDVTHLFLT